MKSLKSRIASSVLVMGALIVCMAAAGGCGSSLNKAETAAATIAATLHTAADVNHALKTETPDEKKFVAQCIKDAAEANEAFVAVLGTAEKNGGKVDKPSLLAAFATLSDKIDTLQSQGVLHLKSPEAQLAFAGGMATLRTLLATLQNLYPPNTSHIPGRAPLLALALTPAEIEELIALAIAAGSALAEKLIGLRGKTGEELLAEASADDAAAIAQANTDGAQ